MNTLVTGGAGFIGSNVVRLLLERGHEVTVFDNLSSGYASNVEKQDVRFVNGDILDVDALHNAAIGCESIWHLAASVGNLRAIHGARWRPDPGAGRQHAYGRYAAQYRGHHQRHGRIGSGGT